jgi:hypothetical protein
MRGIPSARGNDTEDPNEKQLFGDLVRGDLRCLVHGHEKF